MKNVFLLAVFLLLFSCGGEDGIPEGILSEQEMVNVLIDIRLAEGKVGTLSVGRDSSRVLYDSLEHAIFVKHNVDSVAYRKSYQYYLLNPELYLAVTDRVLDSLKVRQQSLDVDMSSEN